jgi:hypothetical protein
LLRRGRDVVPLTGRGLLVGAFSAGALWLYGRPALDLVLYVVGIAGLALLALSLVVVVSCTLWLRRRLRRLSPGGARRLEAASTLRTGFEAPGLGGVPLVKVRWSWIQPPEVDVRTVPSQGRLVEEVRAARRCLLPAVRRRFVVHDVFGLTRLAWESAETASTTILPNVGRLRGMPIVESMATGDNLAHPAGAPEGDRMEIRNYVPGDPVRNILWKVFARTRHLNVRMPERAVAQTKRTVAYLSTGDRDEPAAAAARVAIESGALGPGWVFGADGGGEATDQPERALLAIARSGNQTDGQRLPGLTTFLDTVLAEGRAHCIVFAPATTRNWLREALEASRRHPSTLSFVLGVDGLERQSRRPLWRRLLLADDVSGAGAWEEMSRVLKQLAAAGCPAVVVDRTSGRFFGRAQQRALSA